MISSIFNQYSDFESNQSRPKGGSYITHLGLIPASLITKIFDTLAGIPAAALTICSFGTIQGINTFTESNLKEIENVIAAPLYHLVKLFNPQIKVSPSKESRFMFIHGLEAVCHKAFECSTSENFIERHIYSRSTYIMLAVALTIATTVDIVSIVPLGTITLISCGKFKIINDYTFRALKFPGIIYDLFFCVVKILNPTSTLRDRALISNTSPL